MSERVEHPWLGTLRRFGDNQLLCHISIDPAIRPARLNGETDAEVLITIGSLTIGSLTDGPELDATVDSAANRIQAALADLENIKTFAITHAPDHWRRHYEAIDSPPLAQRLFLEGFDINAGGAMEVSFDFGDLDMLVLRFDSGGHAQDARLIQ